MSKLLRIGYFGSDLFSINCLKRILPLHLDRPQAIAHIDVITRAPKPSGRGLNHLKEVPIAEFARQNGLPVLRADKKSDFAALQQHQYDLCIAVSYGKLIPSSFLQSLPFGGLNVHPSLLPSYSGPAPLQRALLDEISLTGVTVQTLHPTKFDEGAILANAEYRILEDETFSSLTERLSERGGNLLREILEQGAFDPKAPAYHVLRSDHPYSYAQKIHSNERQIDWSKYTSFNVVRRFNTLGPLYTFKTFHPRKARDEIRLRRIVLEDVAECPDQLLSDLLPPGSYDTDDVGSSLLVKTVNGTIKIRSVNIEGLGSVAGSKIVKSSKRMFGNADKQFITDV
ncbi:DEKNAAC105504 [Brettanomyces naardenensis]|uniref:methionyl-tRNA formyltransferase n=1 Tax=Brettanomyces naardenensis TaxID=13370 RepID=A0A448YU57_BRENA|nr:DEKNAAC105504 [Brettanomyces naardenensis]